MMYELHEQRAGADGMRVKEEKEENMFWIQDDNARRSRLIWG